MSADDDEYEISRINCVDITNNDDTIAQRLMMDDDGFRVFFCIILFAAKFLAEIAKFHNIFFLVSTSKIGQIQEINQQLVELLLTFFSESDEFLEFLSLFFFLQSKN